VRSIADYDPTESIEMKHITLAMREYAAMQGIGRTTLETMNIERSTEYATKQLVQRVSMQVLSDKLVDDDYKARYRYSVYKSAWQHFKADYMPVWFRKRYPVVLAQKSGYVTVKFTRHAEYPKANVALRESNSYEVMLGGYHRIVDSVTQTS
jgi:hypothetical protein